MVTLLTRFGQSQKNVRNGNLKKMQTDMKRSLMVIFLVGSLSNLKAQDSINTKKLYDEINRTEFTPLFEVSKQSGTIPNFDSIHNEIEKKYKGKYADDITIRGKAHWYEYLVHEKKEDRYMPDLISSHVVQIDRFGYDTTFSFFQFINGVSYGEIYLHGDSTQISRAIHWMKNVVDLNRGDYQYEYTDTYASLLYKAGNTDAAIQWGNKALQIAINNKSENDIKYQNEKIDAMKRHEPIWLLKKFQ
jgi:hypothetical protein